MPNEGQRTLSFEVPVGAGDFAPEILFLTSREQLTVPTTFREAHDGGVSEYQVVIEALTADAQLEVDLLNAGADPAVEANWNNVSVFAAVGPHLVESLTRQAVRIRAKSGGTAGTTTASVTWAA